jgi:hypothetical protein
VTVLACPVQAAPNAGSIAVRRATANDDGARRDLMAQVAMDAELALSVRRRPTMDALYALHARDWNEWVVERDGIIEGTGSVLVRDGWIDGRRAPVGYLGDLRLAPSVQGRQLLDRFYAPILRAARDDWGCEHFLTAIIASNETARRALVVRTERADRRGRPRYELLRTFDIRSIQLVLPLLPERTAWHVRPARAGDIPAIGRLLDGDGRLRPFGYCLDEPELRRRLTMWPGLTIESFLVATRPDGTIVGTLALWDAAPVRQTVVTSYAGSMRRVRLMHDALAVALRRPRLPSPEAPFRYLYATHVGVPEAEPSVLRALLRAAYRRARAERFHFISICAPAGDPNDAAYRGMVVTNLRAELHLVTLPDVARPSIRADAPMPGFEMALV